MVTRAQIKISWRGVAALIVLAALVFLASAAWGQGVNLPPPNLPGVRDASTPPDSAEPSSKPSLPADFVPPAIESRLTATQAAAGETVGLVVTLTWTRRADEPTLALDFGFPKPPEAEGLTLFANRSTAQTLLSGNTVAATRVITYVFTADREIVTEVKPVQVEWSVLGAEGKGALSTAALPLIVTKPKFKVRSLAKNPVAIGVLVVIMLAAAGALLYPSFKRPAAKVSTGPEKSAHDLARDRLRELDRLRLAGEYPEYLHGLSREMGRYIEDGLGLKARGHSAGALAGLVEKKLGESWRERIIELEALMDKVKFAGHQPSTSELDRAASVIRDLIDAGEKADAKETSTKGD